MLKRFKKQSKRDRSQNVTCVQNAQFYLTFFEEGEWRRDQLPYPDVFRKLDHAKAEDVRAFNAYVSRRLERIAGMMEVLDSIHDDWAVSVTKEFVKYETVTMDFKDIIAALLEAGYTENDYLLTAEYSRKWGMI